MVATIAGARAQVKADLARRIASHVGRQKGDEYI
jgi:hypothetical protein